MRRELSVEERQTILNRVVQGYIGRGYTLDVHSGLSAQMTKPGWKIGELSCLLIIVTLGIWILVMGVLSLFGVGKPKRVYLSVDSLGRVSEVKHKVSETRI